MVWSARSTRLHAPRRLLALAAVGVVVTTAAAPGLATAAPLLKAADTDGQRVLQSVAVQMAPDGTFTDVTGSTVATADGSDEATTSTRSYSPDQVVGDLPVRILTSYRTQDGSGTDLSELDGHDGRVEIDLTVQNLTVRPENLSYDVNGVSRSQAALVGAPLTVVASTALDGVDASSVVTPTAAKKGAATNGVLSQAADGTTQVQWATILAPPQIGSSATLTLVVDAKDFSAPDFDLSVQPGLVTDPSVGALVDAAFAPGSSSEMKLQARTIGLVGEVNTVLARAGETISKVRSTLDSSADTLGTKTVTDLRSSAVGVASSMRGLDGSVKSLGQDLSSSLKTTRSAALQQLLQTVTTLDRMLGDTSARPQPAAVRGRGCDISVAAPQRSGSVYGNIVAVAGQLSGYAHATDSCKSSLQQSILTSVGPAEPSDVTCTRNDSVTCALYGAGNDFKSVTTNLKNQGDAALALLDPNAAAGAADDVDRLLTSLTGLQAAAADLKLSGPFGRDSANVATLSRALNTVVVGRTAVTEAFATVNTAATAQEAATADDRDALLARNLTAADRLCSVRSDSDPVEAGKLSTDQVNDLRSGFVRTSCPDAGGARTAISASDPLEDHINAVFARQLKAWGTLAHLANAASAEDSLVKIDQGISDTQDQIELLRHNAADEENPTSVQAKIRDLNRSADTIATTALEVSRKVRAVSDQQRDVIDQASTALHKAADGAAKDLQGRVKPQITRVAKNSEQSRAALGKMFDQSATGLSSAAGTIARNGAKTLEAQKRSFAGEQHAAGVRISGQVENGLSMIATGVTSSTRDMEAAGALLRQDLTKVLLDLGDRKVNGSGLLGAMTTGAATARSADYQLALATDKTTSYASVRSADIAGLLLRQAQSDAALERVADLPAFRMDLPSGTEHRTVYTFHIGAAS